MRMIDVSRRRFSRLKSQAGTIDDLSSRGRVRVYCHGYMGYMVCATVKGKVFKQFTLGLGYINQRVWV